MKARLVNIEYADMSAKKTNLRHVSTAANSATDVHIGELVEANNEKRLVDL
jgi:hypothetical protein